MTALLCILCTANALAAKSYTLVKIADGDTVTLKDATHRFRLRLTGIDAPERNQSYGKKSRRALIKLCQGRDITITAKITGTDKYHRSLGRLYCNDIDASLHLATLGLAWYNFKYANDLSIFIAHIKAKHKRIGLWVQEKPLPPWTWRYQQRAHQKKKKRPNHAKH